MELSKNKMKVYYIKSVDEFNKYFKILEQSAIIKSEHSSRIFKIGLDIEFISTANFPRVFVDWIPNKKSKQITCLIQVATNDVVMIFNVVKMKCLPKKLQKMITSQSWMKMGVNVENDLSILSENYNLGHCSGGIELQNLAIAAGIQRPNLVNIYNLLFDANEKKGCSICDWSSDLSQESLDYAAKDAIISYQIGVAILDPSINYLCKNSKRIKKFENEYSVEFVDIDNPHKKNKKVIIVDDSDLSPDISDILNINGDCVSRLQMHSQKNNKKRPIYIFTKCKGHEQKYKCTCKYDGKMTTGEEIGKKKSKQLAAAKMCKKVNL